MTTIKNTPEIGKDAVIDVAYNPMTKKVERVFIEDEVPAEDIFQMFWSQSLKKYVTIPTN